MALSLIPGTDFAAFGSAYQVFTKYCKKWADEAERVCNDAGEHVVPRDSHMKRFLAIDADDVKKSAAVPHPLHDVFNFVAGGSDTTAYSAACAMHYLLANTATLETLMAELEQSQDFIRTHLDHKKIQQLPYLV